VLEASNLGVRVRRVLEQPRLSPPSRSWSGIAVAALLLALIAWVVAGFPAVVVTSADGGDTRDRVPAEAADLRGSATPGMRGSLSEVASRPASVPASASVATSAPAPASASAPRQLGLPPSLRAANGVRSVFDASASIQPASPPAIATEPSRRLSAGLVAAAPEAPRGVMPARDPTSGERADGPEDSGPPQADGSGPWRKIADTGASVGRGSARAGTATAGAFSRAGRRIANVF
jgi:hypothetical protein